MPAIEYLADHRDAGRTVAEMLRGRFQLSWNQAKRLVESGHVRIAGMGCNDPSQRIRRGNRVWIREGVIERKPGVSIPSMPKPMKKPPAPTGPSKSTNQADQPTKIQPTPVNSSPRQNPVLVVPEGAELIYADETVVVLNKPAGLTTMRHADEAAEFGSRAKAYLPKTLQDFLPLLLGHPGARGYAVHRIDRDTSGLVVFARTPQAARHLTTQFRKHTVERRYWALVRGGTPPAGRIESWLVRDRGDGRRGSLNLATPPKTTDEPPTDARRAVTKLSILAEVPGYALVECQLETGRTHQVRIHLGEAGYPLCGERLYDRPPHGAPLPDESNAKRPLLHAVRLGFTHPTTGKTISWVQPPPHDFRAVLESLQLQVPKHGLI